VSLANSITKTALCKEREVTCSETMSLNKLPQEIRDEYRKDPTVPKNILVAIARNKLEQTGAQHANPV